MAERKPGWKQMLQEPNAMGWIGLIVLVIAIGFGALYFGDNSARPVGQTVGASQVAK